MSIKHSLARKKRWAEVPKEKRIELMRKYGFIKNAKMTLAEKKELALKMVKARK